MKKILVLALVLVITLSIVACARRGEGEIPTLDEIRSKRLTDDELEFSIERLKRDELIKVWGEPDRRIEREKEDVWILNEREVLVVSYNLFGRVDDVEIED